MKKLFTNPLTKYKTQKTAQKFLIQSIGSARSMQIEAQNQLGAPKLIIGNRVPRDYFITSGMGESDITIHAGSYHIALRNAGIEKQNIMAYSSIMSPIANKIERPDKLPFGGVLETIMACSHSKRGVRATAGMIYGWLYDRITGEKAGGLVCEYNEHGTEEEAKETLKASLNELYAEDIKRKYVLKDVEMYIRSFVPKKKFGSALVALCFVNHEVPILGFVK